MKPIYMSPGRKLAYGSLFLALAIVSTGVFKLIPMGNLYFLRFSLTPSIIVFASLFLGPVYGAAVGGLSDLIPAFLVPTGEWNFLITIVYVLFGTLPWCVNALLKKYRFLNSSLSLVIMSLAATLIFYGYAIAEGGLHAFFGEQSHILTPIILVLVALLNVGGSLLAFLKLRKRPMKRALLLDVAAVELLVGSLLKALAFYLYLTLLASSPSPLPFVFILAMLLMGLPLNIALDYFFVNVYVSVASKLGLNHVEDD